MFLQASDFLSVAPLLTMIVLGMLVLMIDLGLPHDRKSPLVVVSFVGLLVAAGFVGVLWGKQLSGFGGNVVADDFSLLFQAILLVVAGISIFLSDKYIQLKGINYGEYYALLLFSTSGAMLMATSRELVTIFVGLEVLSIALYILSGFARTEPRSEESAMKYFLLGAFSSGFFLYGIALMYGATGTTMLGQIFHQPAATSTYGVAGAALLLVGLAFKAAIVPFHSWTPDVYEGAPTSVTAFMSAAAKVGAFAALIRILETLIPVYHLLQPVLWVLAVLTMIVGNVVALRQTNIKRMLAYSSIAHAGYILVGLIAHNANGRAGVLFYVLAYTFMNLGAFGVLILLARRGDELTTIEDLEGLGNTQPGIAALMTIFMLSLAGIPPAAGFIGKLFLFFAAVQAHQYALAVIGLLASVVGVVYYLNIIARMWFSQRSSRFTDAVWGKAWLADVAVVAAAIMTIALGVLFGPLRDISVQAGRSLQVAPSTAESVQGAAPISTDTPAVPAADVQPVALR